MSDPIELSKTLFLSLSEARKKDKGGGYLMMSALMMGTHYTLIQPGGIHDAKHMFLPCRTSQFISGKMMAALGLGGVGALALKALGVSMMALMLAGIVALKKLTEGGGDGGHSVHYVCIFIALIPLLWPSLSISHSPRPKKLNQEKWFSD